MRISYGDLKDIDRITAYLKQVPHGTVRVGLRAIVEYIIGNGQHGLKHYGPYKYVARRKAYGQTFSSDKQRRYVMARIREGSIDPGVPHRTGRTQRGYVAVESNGGYRQSIKNEEIGAYFTRDDNGQARLNALAGWRKAAVVIASNLDGALRHAGAAISKFLKGG